MSYPDRLERHLRCSRARAEEEVESNANSVALSYVRLGCCALMPGTTTAILRWREPSLSLVTLGAWMASLIADTIAHKCLPIVDI